MTSGIFCLVPGSFAIAGGLSDTVIAPGLGLGVFGVGAVIALRMVRRRLRPRSKKKRIER